MGSFLVVVEGYAAHAVNFCNCLETVWSPKRLAGVPLGGGQGLPGCLPSIRPHWVAAVVRVTDTLVRAAR